MTEINEFYASAPDEPEALPVPISESFAPTDEDPTENRVHARSSEPTITLSPPSPEPQLSFDLHESVEMLPEPPTDPSPPVMPSEEPSTGVGSNETYVPPPAATPRRSTRAGASKPEGFFAKLNRGEGVADYTACHMRATECERLYGAEPTLEAGPAEVTNMIGRGAAVPQDYRTLSEDTIREALPSFLFYTAKDELPREDPKATTPTCKDPKATTLTCKDPKATTLPNDSKSAHSTLLDPRVLLSLDTTGGQPTEGAWVTVTSKLSKKHAKRSKRVKIKGRWVGGGHRQRRAEVLAERVAPTARSTTHNIVMSIAAYEGRRLQIGDIPAAYLQADHVPANGKPVHIMADRYTTSLVVKAYPKTAKLVRPNGTMVLRVAKAMYGLVESAWLWYKELEAHLLSIGYTVSEGDRGLFFKKIYRDGVCVASNIASVHVDDIASAASNSPAGKLLEEEVWTSMERKWPGIKRQSGPDYKHLSWNIRQDPCTMKISKSQRDYLIEVVQASGVSKEQKLPSRCDLLTSDPNSPPLPPHGVSNYRSTLQKVAYAREGRPDFDFVVSYLQSKQSNPTEQDWRDLGHLLGYIKRFPDKPVVFNPTD